MRAVSVFICIAFLFALPAGLRADSLVPAGTLVQCTISEPNLSSKTMEIGDPILCHATGAAFDRATVTSGAWLSGRFEDYKDPGHFVGKGWMQLSFDRVFLGSDRVLPLNAKVVHAPGLNVDRGGRILGHGHAVRDTVEWMIPVLWPEKVLTLPARGPRPRLKQETRLTVRLMDDLLIPSPTSARTAIQTPYYGPQQEFRVRPQSYGVEPSRRGSGAVTVAVQPQRQPAALTLLILKSGDTYAASAYWFESSRWLRFVSAAGASVEIPVANLDIPTTVSANRVRGVSFSMPQ
jgi:hypothetical protein